MAIKKCAATVVSTIKGPKGTVEVEQEKRTSGGHRVSMDRAEMSAYMDRAAQLTGYSPPTEEERLALGDIHN